MANIKSINGNPIVLDDSGLEEGSVKTSKIENLAVIGDKINNLAVRREKIADGAVNTDKLSNGAVTREKLGVGAVTYREISTSGTDRIHQDNINDNAVNTRVIADGAVTDEKLSSNGVKASKVPWPTTDKLGRTGQVLSTLADGSTKWVDQQLPSEELMRSAVVGWLDEHPEATTTVQDASITPSKFSDEVPIPNGIIESIVNDEEPLLEYGTFLDQSGLAQIWSAAEEKIGAMTNRSYVGRYGAVEGDDPTGENDWSAIFAEIAAVSDTIYLGSGKWDMRNGVTIPAGIKKVFGNGATVYTSYGTSANKVDHLIDVSGAVMFSGIDFVGSGKVSKLLTSSAENAGNRLQVTNCNFRDVGRGNYGIYNAWIGLLCTGCYFYSSSNAYSGGTAIRTHTDNQIVGCKFFKFDNSIAAQGVNCGNCYFWGNTACNGYVFVPETFPDYTIADDVPFTYDVIATNCEFDCIRKLVINPNNVVIKACQFYWNPRDINEDCHLFYVSGTRSESGAVRTIKAVTFSDNVIKFQQLDSSKLNPPITDPTYAYEVYSFGCYKESSGVSNNFTVMDYVSENNVCHNKVYGAGFAEDALKRYHLVCGWVYNDMHASGSYPYAFRLRGLDNNTVGASNIGFFAESNEGFWEFAALNGAYHTLIKNITGRTGTRVYLGAKYLTDGSRFDIWLPCTPFAINSIHIRNVPLPTCDMCLEPPAETPDYSNYTTAKILLLSTTEVTPS